MSAVDTRAVARKVVTAVARDDFKRAASYLGPLSRNDLREVARYLSGARALVMATIAGGSAVGFGVNDKPNG